MSLETTNNVTPRTNPTLEDLRKQARDIIGEVKAEALEERQAKLREANQKQKRIFVPEGGTFGAVRRAIQDDIAEKEIEAMSRFEKARMFARWVQCTYQAKQAGGDMGLAIDLAEQYGQKTLAKAMQVSVFADGGFMVEPGFSQAIIEELLATTPYLRQGPERLDLPQGGLTMPYEDDGPDATWSGEGDNVNADDPTGGQVRMQPHKLTTIVGMSNDLLRARPGQADTFIINRILANMRVKLDVTLLRSAGTSNEPRGLRSWVQTANKKDWNDATITLLAVRKAGLELQNILEENNVDLFTMRPAYFTSPRTKNFLRSLQLGAGEDGGAAFPEIDQGEWLGIPLGITSQIPVNLGGGGDETEIYLAAMGLMILGVAQEMMVDVFPGGSYLDSSGATRSGISRDETPIRVIGQWDHVASQRGKEIALYEGIDWKLS